MDLRFTIKCIASVLIGFFIADLSLVVFLAPELANPDNWGGLGSLAITAMIMYVGVGLYMLFFSLIVALFNRALALKFDHKVLAVISAIAAILFLLIQEKIHSAILPRSVSPNVLIFYLPTAITLAILATIMAGIRYLFFRHRRKPRGIPALLRWPGLVFTSLAAFLVYASYFTMLNVLSVYSEEEQRDLNRESVVNNQPAARDNAPNFMVVIIEAFRWDEFTAENAPFLAQLASQNIHLGNYHVVASATRPSTTSLFTSLYPAQHGAYNLAFDQEFSGQTPITTTKVSDAIQSFPKQLQENGYNTMMVTSNKLASDRVFGFEVVYNQFNSAHPYHFNIPDPEPFLGFFILQNSLKHWKIFKALLFTPNHSRTYFDASRLDPVVKRLLENRDERPFMLYLHYIEPHTPYYADPYQSVQLTPLSRNGMLELYRQEIARIDRSFAALYEEMKSRGDLDNTWILITSDHGEEFYDHGNWGHGKSLYPEVIKVPAILVPPQENSSIGLPLRLDQVIESVDIAPTIGDLAGIEPPQYWEGASLAPLLNGQDTTDHDTVLSQFNDGRFLWSSGIKDDWQIIYKEPSNAIELSEEDRVRERETLLYNIAADPMAQWNVFGNDPNISTAMTNFLNAELLRLETSAVLFQGEKEEVNEEQLEQLRALGYID